MRVLVLSPHRDDAAFSCGLTLDWLLRRGDAVTIVNVCTISSYAPYTAAHGAAEEVTAIRRKEDEAFSEMLRVSAAGADSGVDLIDLAWKDAPLRWGIEDERVLDAGDLRADEADALVEQFASLPACDVLLAPISLGNHVDHRLVHRSARAAFAAEKLIFYEDLPYACRLSESSSMDVGPDLRRLGRSYLLPAIAEVSVKREAVLCYPSQVASEVAMELEDYAKSLGGRERFYGSFEAVSTLGALQIDIESRQQEWEPIPDA